MWGCFQWHFAKNTTEKDQTPVVSWKNYTRICVIFVSLCKLAHYANQLIMQINPNQNKNIIPKSWQGQNVISKNQNENIFWIRDKWLKEIIYKPFIW